MDLIKLITSCESVSTETQSVADLRKMADDMGITKPIVELMVVGITGKVGSESFRQRYENILNMSAEPNQYGWQISFNDLVAARAMVLFSEALEVEPL